MGGTVTDIDGLLSEMMSLANSHTGPLFAVRGLSWLEIVIKLRTLPHIMTQSAETTRLTSPMTDTRNCSALASCTKESVYI